MGLPRSSANANALGERERERALRQSLGRWASLLCSPVQSSRGFSSWFGSIPTSQGLVDKDVDLAWPISQKYDTFLKHGGNLVIYNAKQRCSSQLPPVH